MGAECQHYLEPLIRMRNGNLGYIGEICQNVAQQHT